MATKQKQAPKKDQQEKSEMTLEERVSYFEWKLGYWQRKSERLLAPAKKARAKRRIAHYTEKLAEATKLAAEAVTD